MKQKDILALLIHTDKYLLESKEWLLHSYIICSEVYQ